MGNRVTLYNLTQAIPSSYLYLDTLDQVPEDIRDKLQTLKFAHLCDTNDTGIPIPWMLYFGLEDYQLASVYWNEETTYQLPMPCTSIENARKRIEAALPIFERLAGNPAIAHEYWQEAVDLLSRLPFQYLAMGHTEWVSLFGDEDTEAIFEAFKAAYLQGAPSDDFLFEYSGYTKGVQPYSHDEWDRLVTRFNIDDERQMNAIAMGYGHSGYSTLYVTEHAGDELKDYTIEC